MLLTLSAPTRSDFDYKHLHDYTAPKPYPRTASHSPKVTRGLSPLPSSLPASPRPAMSSSHRGLPPPAAMTLPDPSRPPPPPPPPMPASLNQMPAPPSQWQGAEESMRNWLAAKAEEDRRRQEEEKTRQESLRLEQRKVEQSMLRESIQGGVPPHLVPMIFAGIGGAGVANANLDWLQHYVAQLQSQQQQVVAQAQGSPDLRREQRLITPAQSGVFGQAPPAVPGPPSLPGQAVGGPAQPSGPFSASALYTPGSMSPASRARAMQGYPSGPKLPPHSQLPRLTTNEMQIQPPPAAPVNLSTIQQSQQQEPQTSSPSIYFHHWVPPTTQSGSGTNPPATPSDYTSSPKKRKAQGAHQAPPAPSSAPQFTSPSFSHVSGSTTSTPGRKGHARTRSDQSTRVTATEQPHQAGRGRAGTLTGAESSRLADHRPSRDVLAHEPVPHAQLMQQQPLPAPPRPGDDVPRPGFEGPGMERMPLAQRELRSSGLVPQRSRPGTPKRETGAR
ncbi:hypothetical protein HDK64DRAFT_20021 [Phyllosticta capitalensis]